MFSVGGVGSHSGPIYHLTLGRYVRRVLVDTQPIHGQYISWQLIECQSSIGWMSIEYHDSFGWYVSHYSTDTQLTHISANILTNTQPIPNQHLTEPQPILNWYSTNCWLMYWPCIGPHSADTCRHIDPVLADILVDGVDQHCLQSTWSDFCIT